MTKKLFPFLIASLMMSLAFGSCLYGIKGNGKVVKNERRVDAFESLSVSAGLEVILLQDTVIKVIVEADENLQNIIRTEVSNGELKIYPEKRIGSCTSKRVIVTIKTIHALEASSGSDVNSKIELKMPSLQISASSGANINLELMVSKLNVEGSSGSNIYLKGTTESLDVDGSSGANIKATDLQSKTGNAGASSGANLKINVAEKINAQASSGGNIRISGNPKERNIEKSSGGNINFN
jgi:hypothetical protein